VGHRTLTQSAECPLTDVDVLNLDLCLIRSSIQFIGADITVIIQKSCKGLLQINLLYL